MLRVPLLDTRPSSDIASRQSSGPSQANRMLEPPGSAAKAAEAFHLFRSPLSRACGAVGTGNAPLC